MAATAMGRFSAAKVGGGPDKSPLKSIITGGPNVGKTWFVSTIANDDGGPVFMMPIEEGLKGACPDANPQGFKDDYDRWMTPTNIAELHQMLDAFKNEVNAPVDGPNGTKRRPFRHLGVDSLSGVEKLVLDAACGIEHAKHMSDKDFKKVWDAAMPLWQGVQSKLDDVRRSGVNIWLIAHATEVFDAAVSTGETYRKWDLMLRGTGKTLEEARHLWRAWADNILFLVRDVSVQKGDKTRRAMAKIGGRFLVTRETGAVYAKTRMLLPERVPATWPDLKKAFQAGTPAKADKTREQIATIAAQLEPDDRAAIESDLSAAKTPSQLAATLSRAQGMLAMLDRDDAPEDDAAAASSTAQTNGAAPTPKTDEEQLRLLDQGLA